jgi:nickel-dependent lactate racemase
MASLRTAAWYGDRLVDLQFPSEWQVTTLEPSAPPPLSDEQIARELENPAGQPPIRELCRGKRRPLIIIDDLNRPTPTDRIIPIVLRHFHDAGIEAREVTILLALGTHGAPRLQAVARKVGPEAARYCRVLLHDCRGPATRLGRTSIGTPVLVNSEVPKHDFIVGIGSIYPNYTAGFGGGSKLALGVLDLRAISYLHFRHRASGWGAENVEHAFRKDLDEIAGIIGLHTTISVHIDATRQAVRVVSGDYRLYWKKEVEFAREMCRTPVPGDADVVVSNAYPNDLSLTFVRMKGTTPLDWCSSTASRIAIAACSEGAGSHGIAPVVSIPWLHRHRDRLRRLSVTSLLEIKEKLARRLRRGTESHQAGQLPQPPSHKNPIWIYRTAEAAPPLPDRVGPMRISRSWPEILAAVQAEQGDRRRLKVLIYACAPLQCLEATMAVESVTEARAS